jgi:hypothetical protein
MHGCRRRVHRLRPWRVVYDLCRDAELLALLENDRIGGRRRVGLTRLSATKTSEHSCRDRLSCASKFWLQISSLRAITDPRLVRQS